MVYPCAVISIRKSPFVLLDVAVGESGRSSHMMASDVFLYIWRSRFSSLDIPFAPKIFNLDNRTCLKVKAILELVFLINITTLNYTTLLT